MSKLDGKEIERRYRSIHDNVLSEAWMNQYMFIFHFFDNVVTTKKGNQYLSFSNQDYAEAYNGFEYLKSLQPMIEDNEVLEDWFKDFSFEVTMYLMKIFENTNKHFNPYENYNFTETTNTDMLCFFDVIKHLNEFEMKYFRAS